MDYTTSQFAVLPPAKPKRSKRKVAIVGGALATVALPSLAWAAVTLFGYGSITAAAAEEKELTIAQAALTAPLTPGKTVGAKGLVTNPNNYPVKVTGVVVKASTVEITPSPAACKITPAGTATTFPTGGDGIKQAIAAPVTIPAGGSAWVTVPNSMTQATDAEVMCAVKADFAVVAETA